MTLVTALLLPACAEEDPAGPAPAGTPGDETDSGQADAPETAE